MESALDVQKILHKQIEELKPLTQIPQFKHGTNIHSSKSVT